MAHPRRVSVSSAASAVASWKPFASLILRTVIGVPAPAFPTFYGTFAAASTSDSASIFGGASFEFGKIGLDLLIRIPESRWNHAPRHAGFPRPSASRRHQGARTASRDIALGRIIIGIPVAAAVIRSGVCQACCASTT